MKLSRHQLYEQVWSKPMTQLSKEYGLSDVGLAKICRKHGIPLPERGHWAKIQAGYKVVKKALPRKDYNPDIEILEKPPITEAVIQAKLAVKEKQTKTINDLGEVHVPTRLDSPHRLTKKTQKYFEDIAKKVARNAKIKDWSKIDWSDRAPSADNGRYQCWPEDGYHLKVSMISLHRALCFLDALVKKLEKLGFKIEDDVVKKQYGREQKMEAVKDGERISFKLAEGYKQSYLTGEALALAKKENSWASGLQRTPSGIFTFTLNGKERWNEKRYIDGAKKLEDHLPAIVAEFINRIDEEKQARAQKIQDEINRRERERLRAIEQKRKEARQRQYSEVLQESEQIKQFDQLELYLNTLEAAYIEQHGQLDANVQTWFDLVRSTAKAKHPVTSRLEYLNTIRNLDQEKIDWQ